MPSIYTAWQLLFFSCPLPFYLLIYYSYFSSGLDQSCLSFLLHPLSLSECLLFTVLSQQVEKGIMTLLNQHPVRLECQLLA